MGALIFQTKIPISKRNFSKISDVSYSFVQATDALAQILSGIIFEQGFH